MGAPKAGTTALHAALTQHPEIFMSNPKEPKYWMCDDAPPPHWRGPGDKHSQQEWVWRRADYERLFEAAPAGVVRGESTPFYLWHRAAQRRIAEHLPEAKLIAVVRDPIDRAYSNWMHLWSDGLEPLADFEAAFAKEHERIAKGWAPFWRYAELGRYGEQLAHLFSYVDRERVLVLRYRSIVDDPRGAVDRPATSWGSRPVWSTPSRTTTAAASSSRGLDRPSSAGCCGPAPGPGSSPRRRCGAAPAPRSSRRLASGDATRPKLSEEARARLLPFFADDIALLARITGENFDDWLSTESRGSFQERRGCELVLADERDEVVGAVVTGGLDVVADAAPVVTCHRPAARPMRSGTPRRRTARRSASTEVSGVRRSPSHIATPVVSNQLDMASGRPS